MPNARKHEFESGDELALSALAPLPVLTQLVELSPLEQIATLRAGVSPAVVDELVEVLGLTKEQLLGGIGVAVPTVNRKLRAHAPLSSADSERVVGLVRLLTCVRRWTPSEEAQLNRFDADEWLGRWLATSNPALGGERPLALLDTGTGQQLVESVLASMESGAYW